MATEAYLSHTEWSNCTGSVSSVPPVHGLFLTLSTYSSAVRATEDLSAIENVIKYILYKYFIVVIQFPRRTPDESHLNDLLHDLRTISQTSWTFLECQLILVSLSVGGCFLSIFRPV